MFAKQTTDFRIKTIRLFLTGKRSEKPLKLHIGYLGLD